MFPIIRPGESDSPTPGVGGVVTGGVVTGGVTTGVTVHDCCVAGASRFAGQPLVTVHVLVLTLLTHADQSEQE